MNGELNKDLIFSYFSGKATAFEKQLIDEWAEKPQNREQFYKWLHEWEMSNLQFSPDVEMRLNEHWSRIHHHSTHSERDFVEISEGEIIGRIVQKRNNVRWRIVAAVFIFMTSFLFFKKDHLLYKTYRTGFNETISLVLSDGSQVVLNSNSLLQVPRYGFGKDTREVMLEGEAEFDVKHMADDQKFIVKTVKGVDVVVLGTMFNVYTRTRGTKVVLNEGSVQLNYKEGEVKKQLIMTPGDLVTFDDYGHKSHTKTETPEAFSAWKSKKIVFSETSLYEISKIFEENFGVKVMIPDSNLSLLTVSGSFPANNAQELLSILTEGSGLNFQRIDDNSVVILAE